MRRLFLVVVIALAWPLMARADEPVASPEEIAKAKQLLESLHPHWGPIPLPQAHAVLNLGRDYYFLDADDAKKVLIDWGNPPDIAGDQLGMIFKVGTSPVDTDWSVIVSYRANGYVSDADAHKTNYDDVLSQLRDEDVQDNPEREKAKQPTIYVTGWAQPPSYDAVRHVLIWAQELQASNEKEHALNYDVRVLGRAGVLSLNVVARMSDLPLVRTAATALETTASFDEGHRYADYKPGVDNRAAYGLAGLVLGGAGLVAVQKVGLFAAGLLILKKAAFFIVAGAAGAWAWLRRRFAKPKTPV